jgi:hypothetical protein
VDEHDVKDDRPVVVVALVPVGEPIAGALVKLDVAFAQSPSIKRDQGAAYVRPRPARAAASKYDAER